MDPNLSEKVAYGRKVSGIEDPKGPFYRRCGGMEELLMHGPVGLGWRCRGGRRYMVIIGCVSQEVDHKRLLGSQSTFSST
jgi:hypothetical protein